MNSKHKPPARHNRLVLLHRSCRQQLPELKANAERLWWTYEVLETLLLTRTRSRQVLEIPPVLRETVATLEALLPEGAEPLPNARGLAEEFYRHVDPACQVDKYEGVMSRGYVTALLAMSAACQALYFIYGQLMMVAKYGVGYLSDPKREVLRLQLRLE